MITLASLLVYEFSNWLLTLALFFSCFNLAKLNKNDVSLEDPNTSGHPGPGPTTNILHRGFNVTSRWLANFKSLKDCTS